MRGMQAVKLRVKPPKSVVTGFAHPKRNVSALGIRPGMAIADFGSGSGAYVLAIAEALRGFGHVYAIDIQRDLLRRIKNEASRRGYHNAEIILGDVEKPRGSKIADGRVDLVIISNLLFQLVDKSASLAEANRILKPGGRLAIIDWTDSQPVRGRGIGPAQKDIVSKTKAVGLASATGFILSGDFPAGAHHYGLIFRRK